VTTNQRITEAAYAAARGTLPLPDASGLCLAATRIIVEHGLFNGRREFYRWLTHPVERKPGAPQSAFTPVARDMERSLTRAGMSLTLARDGRHATPDDTLQPGDLLFRWDSAAWSWGEVPFYGHVGVLLHGGLVIENIRPDYRAHSLQRGVTSLTPIDRFVFTTAVRFDPAKPPA
jgi:hypothetical protein